MAEKLNLEMNKARTRWEEASSADAINVRRRDDPKDVLDALPSDAGKGTDEVAERDERNERLLDAVKRLPLRQRQVIRLLVGLGRKRGAEFSQKEIAEKLGITRQHVWRLQEEGLATLKRLLERTP